MIDRGAVIIMIICAAVIGDGVHSAQATVGGKNLPRAPLPPPPIMIVQPGGHVACGPYKGAVRFHKGRIIVYLKDDTDARRIGAGETPMCKDKRVK